MKIAVINFSGNVGKTTVARQLLAPRLNNAPVISVESINSDGTDDEAIRGKQFGQLQEAMLLQDNVVVDIGASNVEDFVDLMTQYEGSHEDYDFYVVPTVSQTKQQRDTISTIEALAEIGIPSRKIRLLFNMLEKNEQLDVVFSALHEYHRREKKFTLSPKAVIRQHEVFGRLKGNRISIADANADQTDYKELLKAAKEQEKVALMEKLTVKRLASNASSMLDEAFKALLK